LSFDTVRFDTDGIYDSANPKRLTCKTAGKYLITGNVQWAANTAGHRVMRIYLNGTTSIADVREPPNILDQAFGQLITTIYDLNVGDYIELQVNQNTGADLDVVAVGNYSPEFMMQRIG